jgi:hypothetical protein
MRTSQPKALRDELTRSNLDLESDEAKDPTHSIGKHVHSPNTRKRRAENNAQHYRLKKQRGMELKEMIPETFLKRAQNEQGLNWKLICTINAIKLYIASLLNDKKQLQEQIEDFQNQYIDIDKGSSKGDEIAPEGRPLRSHTIQRIGINAGPSHQPTVGAAGAVDLSGLDGEHGGAGGRWPNVNDKDGTFASIVNPRYLTS